MTWESRMINMHPEFGPFYSRAATCPCWVIGNHCQRRVNPTAWCLCQSRLYEHVHGWTVMGERVLTAEPYDVHRDDLHQQRLVLAELGMRLLILTGSAYDPDVTTLLAIVQAGGLADTALAPDRC